MKTYFDMKYKNLYTNMKRKFFNNKPILVYTLM